MPRFSVLMANYNNGHYIDEAIGSVLAQTFADWELVIIDDASQDDSLHRIEKYFGDPRIQLYVKESNEGYTKALIYGLTKVTSGIVGILDSDDSLMPEAIAKVYAVHDERPDVGLVLTQIIVCDSNLQPWFTTINTPEHLREPVLWMRGFPAFRTFKLAVYRKTAGLDERLVAGEEWDLVFKLEEVAPTHRIDEPLYCYRQRSSASNTARIKYKTRRNMAVALYGAYLRRRGTALPNIPRPALLARMVAAIRVSLEIAQPAQAFFFALCALRIAPFDGASWRALNKAIRGCKVFSKEAVAMPGLPGENGMTRLTSYLPYMLQSNTGNIEPDRLVCIPLVHKRGHCVFGGDYLVLEDGRYRATFEMTIQPLSFAWDPVLVLDVYENLRNKIVLAERQVGMENVAEGPRSISLEFFAKQGQRVEFRVYWAEQCALIVHGITLDQFPTKTVLLGSGQQEEREKHQASNQSEGRQSQRRTEMIGNPEPIFDRKGPPKRKGGSMATSS
jgi:glycosyltransferase involved in cell wall biosynthesis